MAAPRISDDKLLHMRSVAELMYERAYDWTGDAEYAEDMYVLGLLHDIGYIYGQDGHGASGAALMKRNGYARSESIRLHGRVDIDEEEFTEEVLLMQWCDMSVLPGGKKVSCAERLDDIGKRYGFGSSTYEKSTKLAARLAEHGLF